MPAGSSLSTVAERFGMDLTTLNRSIKPLVAAGWVAVETDLNDRRARLVSATTAGRDKIAAAIPHWREAEHEVERVIGRETMLVMNGLMDLATAKLAGG